MSAGLSSSAPHLWRVSRVLLAASLVASCEHPTSTARQDLRDRSAVSAFQAANATGHIPMLDEMFEEVNALAPGFGGMHWAAPGILVVDVTPRGAPTAVEQAMRAVFTDLAWNRVARIIYRPAKYEVRDLQTWRSRVHDIAGADAVYWSDFDETSNIVRVGVDRRADIATLVARARALGAPAGAVAFEHSDRPTVLAYLTAQHRPTVAGVHIAVYDSVITRKYGPGLYAECSLGANVRISTDEPHAYFLTAAHCSNEDDIFRNDGAKVYQPDSATNPAPIGTEVFVPGGSSNLSGCPSSYTCKYSDAALYRYASAVYSNFAYIARDSSNSTTWGIVGSRFRVDSFHVVGDIPEAYLLAADIVVYDTWMHKVAYRTGWTWGPLKHTCMTIYYPGSKALLCQYGAAAYADHGDSGGPMFWWMCCNPNEAWIGGLLHTVRAIPDNFTVFSSISGIKNDIPNLVTY
ncbi:MAG: hypothetical protein U9Q74_16295 [Gemmatimonadota bacterium]|nr:hypothetical protein [Gemmatimonadota bacterium]